MALDGYKRILRRGRTMVANFGGGGLRPYTVTIKLETYSGSLGEGVTLVSSSDLVLSPNPHVTLISRKPAEYHGTNQPIASSTGNPFISQYRIGRITPFNGTIGYTRTQLLPVPANTTQRAIVWMTGDDLMSGGEPFNVINYQVFPFEIILTVESTVRYG